MGRLWMAFAAIILAAGPVGAAGLEAGAASVDITPPTGYPMWGYGARHDKPSVGILDPLLARALVLRAGDAKVALVGLDLGRAPTRESMKRIREALVRDGFTELFLVGSHTHHGPVLELDTWPKPDKPYIRDLEEKLIAVVRNADQARVPARYGVASTETKLNRNRQSKRADKPTDAELIVLRVEDLKGKLIAHAVNFAAHPTMHPSEVMKFSADYPGAMAKVVEAETGASCLFLQGAAGDLSANPPEGVKGPDAFGQRLAADVLKLAASISIDGAKQKDVEIKTAREELKFRCVVDLSNHQIKFALGKAFFPELIDFFEKEYRDGVRPSVTVAVLDDSLGLVGFSGEMFCDHANTLRRRARLPHLFVMGYCNDYQQYFPTIQAVSEGGYGTAPPVASAEIGAGERLTDAALIRLYQLRGKLPEGK
jgi:neutral ceramidase